MTDPAYMANTLLTKLLSKTLGPFKVISASLDTVTMDENGVHNTVSTHKVTLAPLASEAIMEPTETVIRRPQVIAKMKTDLTKYLLHKWIIPSAAHCETRQNRQKDKIHYSMVGL